MQIRSVNTVIAALISVVIVAAVGSGVWWVSSHTYQAMFKEQTVAMHNVVEQTMTALDAYMEQTESMTRMLASQQVVIDALMGRDPLGADWLFKDLLTTTEGYWAAFVFDVHGKVVAGSNAAGANMAGADRSGRGYVKGHPERPARHLSFQRHPHCGERSGQSHLRGGLRRARPGRQHHRRGWHFPQMGFLHFQVHRPLPHRRETATGSCSTPRGGS